MSNLINNNRKEDDNRTAKTDIGRGRNMVQERSFYLLQQLKATKEAAKFREGNGHCGKCQFWDVGNSCLIVEGEIDADDGCKFFKGANL